MDWLLALSLSIISLGIMVSIYEEWATRGLTDTSYTSLWLWVIGLLGIAGWGWVERQSWLCLVAILPALLFFYFLSLKYAGRIRRRRHRP